MDERIILKRIILKLFVVGIDIYEISVSHSDVAEDTSLLLRCDALSMGGVIPDVSTKRSPFIFENHAVHEECRTNRTIRRHVAEDLTGQVHRCESQTPRKFLCSGTANSGRTWSLSALRFSCEGGQDGVGRKQTDSLLQLWNVAGSFSQRINRAPPHPVPCGIVWLLIRGAGIAQSV